jgi:hypothetical protein
MHSALKLFFQNLAFWSLFLVFDLKTIRNSYFKLFFDVVLTGKAIVHITKCILNLSMVLSSGLRTITENGPIPASYKK